MDRIPDTKTREALQAAANVLFLLEPEVKALGCRASGVLEMVRAALAEKPIDAAEHRWNERLAEARSDLCDAISELGRG
jgi:hypothetical protein